MEKILGARYRIKIITYGNGRKEYYPQYDRGWRPWNRWTGISLSGLTGYDFACYKARNEALTAIDNHYGGANRKASIEFEYITKP